MELLAKESESLVCEICVGPNRHLSTAGHEKSSGNPPGPPGKAKYSN